MAADNLTGSRIRERRMIVGFRQADLARKIGISASYLNLIEHNRRRIGGKLLNALATALDVEPAVLTEGAEATLITALREADAAIESTRAELDRVDEFAERFPGWARLLAALYQRIAQLEHTVESLNDRLTHDPLLAASVHEVLSTAASIRSTASILAETDQLEAQWLARFHANINEDSARLAESSRDLANYLESGQKQSAQTAQTPQDEVDGFLAARGYSFPELEADQTVQPGALAAASGLSVASQSMLSGVLDLFSADAAILPRQKLEQALEDAGGDATEIDPLALATQLSVPVAIVLRRLAQLPHLLPLGYVLADRAGSLLLRKAVPGFAIPRGGAACPLWPVFAAFGQPGVLICQQISQKGRQQTGFTAYAITDPAPPATYNAPPLLRAGMLVVPQTRPQTDGPPPIELGAACRVCAKVPCEGRREPSVLLGG